MILVKEGEEEIPKKANYFVTQKILPLLFFFEVPNNIKKTEKKKNQTNNT